VASSSPLLLGHKMEEACQVCGLLAPVSMLRCALVCFAGREVRLWFQSCLLATDIGGKDQREVWVGLVEIKRA
jgi:hypothetical protein